MNPLLNKFYMYHFQVRVLPDSWGSGFERANSIAQYVRKLMLKFGDYRLFSSWAEHFKTHIWYFLSLYYLLVEEVLDLYLKKLESHLPKYALCQVWLKLVKWFWRKRWKCEKLTTTTPDHGQILIKKITLAFGSGELIKGVARLSRA